MKWEEIIAEARTAGVLAFCADGVAVLKRESAETKTPDRLGPEQTPSEVGPEGRQSGQGKSEGAKQSPG